MKEGPLPRSSTWQHCDLGQNKLDRLLMVLIDSFVIDWLVHGVVVLSIDCLLIHPSVVQQNVYYRSNPKFFMFRIGAAQSN